MGKRLFQFVAWFTARWITHHEANKVLTANIGAWFMAKSDPKRFDYYAACSEQAPEIQELKALSAALDIKDMAVNDDGGWDDHHGIGLDMIAQVLMVQHDWSPEEVGAFVGDLTDGFFDFAKEDDEE